MREKDDEPVVKLAKDFIENCKDFEVRELQQKEQTKSTDDPQTEQPDDLRVVRYGDCIEDCVRNKHFVGTDNFVRTEWVGEVDFFRKGGLKIFYTEEVDVRVEQVTTAIILESLYIGEHVLSLSPAFKFDIGQYCYTIKENKDIDLKDHWFEDIPLYVCEYMETEDLLVCVEKLLPKIKAIQITVLYLPKLECALADLSGQEQVQILKCLNDFAFKNHICILAALQPYMDTRGDFNVFHSVHYVQRTVLEQVLPQDAIYPVFISCDHYAAINYRDRFTYAPRQFFIQIPKDAHLRDAE